MDAELQTGSWHPSKTHVPAGTELCFQHDRALLKQLLEERGRRSDPQPEHTILILADTFCLWEHGGVEEQSLFYRVSLENGQSDNQNVGNFRKIHLCECVEQ